MKTINELREWCKQSNISGYSHKNKSELINHIAQQIKKKPVAEIRELCRRNHVPNYLGKKKKDLITYVLQYFCPQQPEPNLNQNETEIQVQTQSQTVDETTALKPEETIPESKQTENVTNIVCDSWKCELCSFENETNYIACILCHQAKPKTNIQEVHSDSDNHAIHCDDTSKEELKNKQLMKFVAENRTYNNIINTYDNRNNYYNNQYNLPNNNNHNNNYYESVQNQSFYYHMHVLEWNCDMVRTWLYQHNLWQVALVFHQQRIDGMGFAKIEFHHFKLMGLGMNDWIVFEQARQKILK